MQLNSCVPIDAIQWQWLAAVFQCIQMDLTVVDQPEAQGNIHSTRCVHWCPIDKKKALIKGGLTAGTSCSVCLHAAATVGNVSHLDFECAEVLHSLLFDVSYDSFRICRYNLRKVWLLLQQVLSFHASDIACALAVQ